MILDGEDHLVLSNYKLFTAQLTENFGPYDAICKVEFELECLQMCNDQKLTKYTISFNRFTAIVHWDEYVLQQQFYKGLASQIKDELACINHADMLCGLCKQASAIDSRYWAQQQEISRDSVKALMPNNNKKETLDNPKSSNPPGTAKSDKSSDKHQTNSGLNSGTSGSKPAGASSNSSDSGEAKRPHLEGKLGADGKLTPEECQWRFDNNLCLFCGAAGHKGNECRKRTSRANANAARVTSDGDDSTSKNDGAAYGAQHDSPAAPTPIVLNLYLIPFPFIILSLSLSLLLPFLLLFEHYWTPALNFASSIPSLLHASIFQKLW